MMRFFFSESPVKESNDNKEKTTVSKIIKSADRMKSLIQNTLEYTKTGKVDVAFERVALDQVLSETLIDL